MTEPNGGGTAAYYNISGVYDTDKSRTYQVVCVQNVACKYRFILIVRVKDMFQIQTLS